MMVSLIFDKSYDMIDYLVYDYKRDANDANMVIAILIKWQNIRYENLFRIIPAVDAHIYSHIIIMSHVWFIV